MKDKNHFQIVCSTLIGEFKYKRHPVFSRALEIFLSKYDGKSANAEVISAENLNANCYVNTVGIHLSALSTTRL